MVCSATQNFTKFSFTANLNVKLNMKAFGNFIPQFYVHRVDVFI